MNRIKPKIDKTDSQIIHSLLEFIKQPDHKKDIGGSHIPEETSSQSLLILRLKNKINYLEEELKLINNNLIE